MRKQWLLILLLVLSIVACGPSGGGETPEGVEAVPSAETPGGPGPGPGEGRCGDGVCDEAEQANPNLCPQDCAASPSAETPKSLVSPAPPTGIPERGAGEYGLLYHVAEHSVTAAGACYSFNFLRFLDAGYVLPDGSGNVVLDLKDNPTSKVASTNRDRYFYISTPLDPLMEIFGVQVFNWDVDGQTLWAADFAGGAPVEVASPVGNQFPGDVAAAPGNRYLLYPFTTQSAQGQANVGVMPKFDPFRSDSSLVIVNLSNDAKATVLADQYNRRLFDSFADFSADGRFFYTIAREGDGFCFVEVALESGTVTDFRTLFPAFDWGALDWSAWFPREGDAAYASFAISPDRTRLLAYKNVFGANTTNPCAPDSSHHLWVLDLERNTIESYRDQPGYVSDAGWKTDSSAFALALNSHGGCYPDYMDACIGLFDKDGRSLTTLVTELKSKITTLGWLSNGNVIAYDVYSTDYVGRLKVVDASTQRVTEVINTQELGYPVSQTNPVTLLFADWVSSE